MSACQRINRFKWPSAGASAQSIWGWAMTEVQGGGKKRTSEVVGMGGGARHPIGQNRGQESTKPVYKEKENPRTRNSKKKEQIKNRKGESKRCGSHSGKRRTDSVRESRGGDVH